MLRPTGGTGSLELAIIFVLLAFPIAVALLRRGARASLDRSHRTPGTKTPDIFSFDCKLTGVRVSRCVPIGSFGSASWFSAPQLLSRLLLLAGESQPPHLRLLHPRPTWALTSTSIPATMPCRSCAKRFPFTSYWLGAPPGEKRSTWQGKRELLASQGFGFVVLFNGRDSRKLKNSMDARQRGFADAQAAAKLARQEGFAKGTVIFLDIEEGGRLPAPYHDYLRAWSERTQPVRLQGGRVLLRDAIR